MLRLAWFLSLIALASSFDLRAMVQRNSDSNRMLLHDPIPEGKPVRIVEPSSYGMSSTGRRLTIDSLVDPIPVSGPTHLLQLKGHCFSLKSEDYNYEFCPFFNVSQREITSRWNSYHGLLGVWSGWLFQNNSDYIEGMRYTFGDKCGSQGYKNTSVVFECSEVNNSLHQVREASRCEYRFIFLTQLVCRKEWRAVFPHLEGDSKESWLKAQLEYSLGFLTDKGVQHLKHDILKRIGWIQELNLTRLRNSEKDSDSGKSFYDRASFVPPYMASQQDCSECQRELEAVKAQLSESKALLKLVNRTFQTGVSANQLHASIILSLSELLASCDTPNNISTVAAVSHSLEDSDNGTVSIDTERDTVSIDTERDTVSIETGTQGLYHIQEDVATTGLFEGDRDELRQLD